ncbi:RING-H2 finger protein ATL67-like [Henckelia pumila]|uniref:RING-H2 finger protein ATL67-like n=1 Tax=Henckelia pumila TaxID=405737 RepID=UPI003C6DCB2E
MLQLSVSPTFSILPLLSPHFPFLPDGPFLPHHHFPPLPMSAAPPPPPPPITSETVKSSFSQNLSSIGLGYAIAIAFGFLVLFSTVLLASYICCRSATARRRRQNRRSPDRNPSAENSVYLPRIIFVAEDDESDSQNVVVGLDQAVINSYPKLVFSKGNAANETVCSICLCEYREAEMLRMLPDCRHCFHVMCVDAWLKLNASCPVCRNSPLPTPLSTPLQEVVPLSQYSDGRRRV